MSFDVNIGRAQPSIKPTNRMNNDGGSGGNTGYMMSGQREKDKKKKNIFDFNDEDEKDTFEPHYKLPEEDNAQMSFFEKLVKKIVK